MKARFKYRIYPKPQQIEPLAKAFGCSRVVWNDALAIYLDAANNSQPIPLDVDKIVITRAKKTAARAWLAEVSNIVLQQSFRDLQQAWSNYFNSLKGKRKGKKTGRPRFKKKQSRQAIRFRVGGFSVHSESVKLAKIGHIPMKVSRPLPSEPSSVTIIKDAAGRYLASFVVELPQEIPPAAENSIGIDLGLNHFAILSNGEKIDNPRLHKKLLKRIKRANKKLSKCQKGSKRRELAKLKLAKLHAQIKDCRTDFLHKLTTKLVRENQALAIEDLNVSGLVKNRKLSRAISDAGWYSFRVLLTAKCDKFGRHLIVINRWEATSQKCSACRFHGGKKELHVREWQCLNCGTVRDRDINAAVNIKVAGRLSETQNGRGRKCKTTSVAVSVEPSTTPKIIQLTLRLRER
jgi:putative transposase